VLDRVLPRAAVHGPKWDRPPPDGDLLVLDIVYVFEILAAVLAAAAIVYLVLALVKPERF